LKETLSNVVQKNKDEVKGSLNNTVESAKIPYTRQYGGYKRFYFWKMRKE
jgi:hypothetical protein